MFGELPAFVARPLRALMDLVAFRKAAWTGLDWITSGLRIDRERLSTIGSRDFQQLKPVYKHKAARSFIASFELELLGPPPLRAKADRHHRHDPEGAACLCERVTRSRDGASPRFGLMHFPRLVR